MNMPFKWIISAFILYGKNSWNRLNRIKSVIQWWCMSGRGEEIAMKRSKIMPMNDAENDDGY